MNNRLLFVLALVIGGAVVAYTQFSGPKDAALDQTVLETPSTDTPIAASFDVDLVPDLILGDPNAPVEIIEYASYTCPHCARFHNSILTELKAEYIDTGKAKLVYREVYFDRFGLWAALVARCGGEMRYFGIQKTLYEEQSEWVADGTDTAAIVENLRVIGKRAGLTDENLNVCFEDAALVEEMVKKAEAEIAEFEVRGTPTVVVNGTKLDQITYAEIAGLIDDALN